MTDRLHRAKLELLRAEQNSHIASIARAAAELASAHALVDIAESLRALRPQVVRINNVTVKSVQDILNEGGDNA